jgi:hypothetical protein
MIPTAIRGSCDALAAAAVDAAGEACGEQLLTPTGAESGILRIAGRQVEQALSRLLTSCSPTAAPEQIAGLVADDTEQPRPELAITAQSWQRGVRLHKRLLDHII